MPRLAQGKTEYITPDYEGLARAVVIEGKPFKEQAVIYGYSPTVAARGPKHLLADSKPLADAFRRATESCMVNIHQLKPLAISRLHREIINPVSSDGLKAIEIAGKFKETDWFVRNTDVQIGIFANLADDGLDQLLPPTSEPSPNK